MLTCAQARKLVAAAFAMPVLPTHAALKFVAYYLRRNYAAYQSHRKRTLALSCANIQPQAP